VKTIGDGMKKDKRNKPGKKKQPKKKERIVKKFKNSHFFGWILCWVRLFDNIVEILTLGYWNPFFTYRVWGWVTGANI
jgi:hypothetical protein